VNVGNKFIDSGKIEFFLPVSRYYYFSVLYISIHRHDDGFFFPIGPDGDYHSTGHRQGEGFNVNIPWNNVSINKLWDINILIKKLKI
jgi:acetoin utilization deacetylase AcuC-like enzyme